MMAATKMIGGIELGGTKINCGLARADADISDASAILSSCRIETAKPEDNLLDIIDFFQACEAQYGKLQGLGVACFGPIDIKPSSAQYGQILATAKPHWSGFSIRQALSDALSVPVFITTDVNGALLAEHALGAAQSIDNCVYITIGTGVGAGVMANGELLNGFLHPEVGHMLVPNNGWQGSCLFHQDCVEGLVSGPAISKHAGMPAEDVPADAELWGDVANVIAHMCMNLTVTLATQKIILGGGVMSKPGLLEKVRHHFEQRMAGYMQFKELVGEVTQFISPPALSQHSGLIGALLLARQGASH